MGPWRAALVVSALCAAGSARAKIGPPVDSKFAAYDSCLVKLDTSSCGTELHGTVILYNGDIFINPDPEYEHLLIDGNRPHPAPDEEKLSDDDVYLNYTQGTLLPNGQRINPFPPDFVANFKPIIKVEAYGVSWWPTSASALVHFPDGSTRQPQYGDHVSISGLYVTDYAHSMYGKYCTTPTELVIRRDLLIELLQLLDLGGEIASRIWHDDVVRQPDSIPDQIDAPLAHQLVVVDADAHRRRLDRVSDRGARRRTAR